MKYNREEFLRIRRTGIGGSDVGAILGVDGWRTPLDVFLEKCSPPPDEPEEENEPCLWGRLMEPVVIKEYERRTNRRTIQVPMQRHPKLEWAFAHIDAMVLDGNGSFSHILEIKTTRSLREEIPKKTLCQVHWYHGLFPDIPYTDLITVRCGSQYEQVEIKRDQAFTDMLLEKCHDFWINNVLKKEPPEPMTAGDVMKLFPNSTKGKTNNVGEETLQAIEKLRVLNEERTRNEMQRKSVTNEIVRAFGDAESIAYKNKIIATYKSQCSTRVDVKAFREENPDLAGKYEKESQSRILRIKNA